MACSTTSVGMKQDDRVSSPPAKPIPRGSSAPWRSMRFGLETGPAQFGAPRSVRRSLFLLTSRPADVGAPSTDLVHHRCAGPGQLVSILHGKQLHHSEDSGNGEADLSLALCAPYLRYLHTAERASPLPGARAGGDMHGQLAVNASTILLFCGVFQSLPGRSKIR